MYIVYFLRAVWVELSGLTSENSHLLHNLYLDG